MSMKAKNDKNENTQHVGLRMPLKLVEQIDEIYHSNKTDRSTEIIRACEEYVNRNLSKIDSIAESSHKYTTDQFKKAETDDALREEILKSCEIPVIKLMYAEIEKRSKEKKN